MQTQPLRIFPAFFKNTKSLANCYKSCAVFQTISTTCALKKTPVSSIFNHKLTIIDQVRDIILSIFPLFKRKAKSRVKSQARNFTQKC